MKRLLALLILLFGLGGICFADIPLATDSCVRADAATLGSSWTPLAGSTWSIVSNQCKITGVEAYGNPVYRNDVTLPQDVYAKATFPTWVTTAKIGPSVRNTANLMSGYIVYCNTVNAGNCTSLMVGKYVTGGINLLQNNNSGVNIAPGSTITIKATGQSPTTIQVFANDVQVGVNYVDSVNPLSTGTLAGMRASAIGGVFTNWEAGAVGNSVPQPTFAVASGALLAPTQVTPTCPIGTLYYTLDGSTPTTTSLTAVPVSVSSAVTVKAICSYGGSDSAVASAVYTFPVDSAAIYSDDFSEYYDPNLALNHIQQFPLDTIPTKGKWTAWLPITGNAGITDIPNHALAPVRPEIRAASLSGYAVFGYNGAIVTARSGWANDQWAQISLPSGADGAVLLRAVADGNQTGYYAYVNRGATKLEIHKRKGGQDFTLAQLTVTIVANAILRFRVSGTTLGAIYNGVALQVTDSSNQLASGSPGLYAANSTGFMSDFSAGNIDAADSTVATVYVPTYPTYTAPTIDNGTWTMAWPWFQAAVPENPSQTANLWTGVFAPALIDGTQYGLGQSNGWNGIIAYRGGEFGSNQWQRYKVGIEPDNKYVSNWFSPLQHQSWIPGTGGGCAAAGTLIDCYDGVSYYPGVETMARAIWDNAGNSNLVCGAAASHSKDEYKCTPFMHITKVTPARTDDAVITVGGTFYTPRKGDEIYVEYVAPQIRVACKGNPANYVAWAPSHAYTAGNYVIDSNGNWQLALTSGTSGVNPPNSWASQWGVAVVGQGDTTTDAGVTWEYMGQPCPTQDGFSWVENEIDNDLAGAKGIPALWLGQGTLYPDKAIAPVFYGWSAGTATINTACSLDPNLCTNVEQPRIWIVM